MSDDEHPASTVGPHPDDLAAGDRPPPRDYTGDFLLAQDVPAELVQAAAPTPPAAQP